MAKQVIALIIFIIHSFIGLSQNLVPNPGFEEYQVCPGSYNTDLYMFRVPHWCSASLGTPDHFHTCSAGEADVPHNWAGTSFAYEGNGYVGLFLWMSNLDYREYLQCRLLEPLVADSLYRIHFRFKLSSYSQYSIDRIGMLLTDTMASINNDHQWRIKPTLESVRDTAFSYETGEWELFNIEYRANGGEQFLTIGNFAASQNTGFYKFKFRPVQQELLRYSAYYYIDDVHVLPTWTNNFLLADFSLSKPELNKTYVLSNIQFEFNSYRLVQSSFYQLDEVIRYLMNNPAVKIQLAGHTDDVGSDSYNLNLSERRAGSVSYYLVSRGIEQDRISTTGYGKTKPLVLETTEEARQINRRVEVTFVK